MKNINRTVKAGFFTMLVFQFAYIILSIVRKQPINKENIFYGALFLVLPIIYEGLKSSINYLKKK